MRVIVIIKGNEESEAGIMPSEKLLNAMGKFNEELVNAGIMLSGEGLHPSSKAKRIKFSGDGKLLAVSAGSTSVYDAVSGDSRYSLFSFESEPRGKIALEHLLDFDNGGRGWATAYEIGVTPPERSLVRCAADGKTWLRIVPKLTG